MIESSRAQCAINALISVDLYYILYGTIELYIIYELV